MGEEKFDAIIVGGGLAGLTAAYVLVNAGKEVLLIERGGTCGAKNMTGGRLYGDSLEKIIPGFAGEAPVERTVVREQVFQLTDSGIDAVDYKIPEDTGADQTSYTVLRGKFDNWLAEKVEEAGGMLVTGFTVNKLLVENGKVVGVDAAGEEMFADVVILADGVNSLLARQMGMKEELDPKQTAVGAKEVIKLGESVINERFGLSDGEGTAMLYYGYPTDGCAGEGFLYTNKDTVSVGVTVALSDIGKSEIPVPQLLDRFKEHPSIAPYLEGGDVTEYSGHLLPEGGADTAMQLYTDGLLITGDAAGLCLKLGFTVRGMDYAVESGRLAAETVIKAHENGDFSAASLASYQEALNQSFIMQDLEKNKAAAAEVFRKVEVS